MKIDHQLALLAFLLPAIGASGQGVAPVPSAASAFPATPATVRTEPALAVPSVASAPSRTQPGVVRYADGRLQVVAENSSLNQILREIANQIGIKMTGGVADERVFGSYGPAEAASVLTTLLNGTGANMLLWAGKGGELIITPRTGGASPPVPGELPDQGNSDDAASAPLGRPRGVGTMPVYGRDGQSARTVATPTAPPVTPEAFSGSPVAAPADSGQQAPGGVRTPQQIYDQLIRIQQQQAGQQAHPTSPQ